MLKKLNIVFLHAALSTSDELLPLMGMFKENCNVFTFNFTGHGKSNEFPNDFRIDFFAKELDQFLSQNGLKDIIVFGHSMGGYVALYHKAHFENSPIKMIFTYGTKFNWSISALSKELPSLDPDYVQQKIPQFAKLLAERHGERWKLLLRSTAHMMQNLQRIDGLTKEDLEEVDIPVFLLLGEQDRMVTQEETNLTSRWLTKAQVKIISHSKHEMDKANLKEIYDIMQEAFVYLGKLR
ncbi:MAG: alpha/beta fold hydrolase [Bacteriovoracaceae bacterium]